MALYNVDAIVIGTSNWGEADKLITFFSRDRGKIKAMAYGCRRTKSRLSLVAQLFSVVNIQLAQGQRLDIVRNCDHKGFLVDFATDFVALAYASFVAEFVSEIFEEKQPQKEVYDKLLLIIPIIGKHNPRVVAVAAFFQLLEYTGSQLQYENCVSCGKKIAGDSYFSCSEGGALCSDCAKGQEKPYIAPVRKLIVQLMKLDWQNLSSFKVQGKDLQTAEKIMVEYLELVLEKRLKSLDFIEQIT